MLNDVSFPPLDSPEQVPPRPRRVPVRPIFTVDHVVADVTLFDHPDFAASGPGNFWLLGMVGLLMLALVLLMAWVIL